MAGSDLTTIALEAFDGAVFDLDGVVTQTANVHAAAWKDLFDDYLRRRAERTGEPFQPFDIKTDYLKYVDGKPRYEGVRSFLESRGIALPYGSPDDPPGRETVCGLGNQKNELFHKRLERDGVQVYDSSVRFIRDLRDFGLKTALVSSSRNTKAVLKAGGLTHLFDACVDGAEAARLGLKGKPHPDIFLHAVRLLDISPARAFGVEDALSGVEALRRAGYGLVIGIDRSGQGEALRQHGADLVVRDLAELRLEKPHATVELPNALQHHMEIAQRLERRRPAVFLDYDGTLTPIVARPELAVLSEDMRKTIEELAALCTVAIISGRDRTVIEQMVGVNDLIYAGSHGLDIAGPGGLRKEHERAAEFLPALDHVETQLQQALANIPGAIIERKRFAITVHYRLVAAEDLGTVRAAVDMVIREAQPNLRRTGEKKVCEIRPNLPWDKGQAVLWLIRELGLDRPDVLPIYIGDDGTDEDAFAALRNRDAITILVSSAPQRTAASFVLANTDEVGRFLRMLVERLRAAIS